jgi:hypothetical protein
LLKTPSLSFLILMGGCQTPISSAQRFAHDSDTISQINKAPWTPQEKVALLDLCGTDVWTYARKLLAARIDRATMESRKPQRNEVAIGSRPGYRGVLSKKCDEVGVQKVVAAN